MRRLLYCGEWIESHALHVFLLHAPDFLGYDGAIEMAADHPDGRRARPAAEEGRQPADDPGRRPRPSIRSTSGWAASTGCRRVAELRSMRPHLERALDDALQTVKLVGRVRLPGHGAALRVHRTACRGRLPHRGGHGGDLRGRHVRRTRLPVRTSRSPRPRTPTRCTPGSTPARAAPTSSARWPATPSTTTGSPQSHGRRPREAGLGPTCRNPFRSIIVRAVELVEACHEALRIIDGWAGELGAERRGPAPGRRGLRRHRGAARSAVPPLRPRRGRAIIQDAQIVPPTSQNQAERRGRPARDGRGAGPTSTTHAAPASLRAGDPQLRPVHLLCHPLPRPDRGPDVTAAAEPDGRNGVVSAPLVVGLGSSDRGDDAVGPRVASAIAVPAPAWSPGRRARGPDRASRPVGGTRTCRRG